MFDPSSQNNFSAIIANIAATTAQLQIMLNSQTSTLAKSLKNTESVTDNLAKNNDKVTQTLSNVEKATSNRPRQRSRSGENHAVHDHRAERPHQQLSNK